MRLVHTLAALLSQDNTQEDQVFERVGRTEGTDDFQVGDTVSFKLLKHTSPDPSTTKTITLPGTTPGLLYVQSDKEVTVSLNGGDLNLVLKPRAKMNATDGSTIPGFIYMMAEGVTALTVTNDSEADDATVIVGSAGDAE